MLYEQLPIRFCVRNHIPHIRSVTKFPGLKVTRGHYPKFAYLVA